MTPSPKDNKQTPAKVMKDYYKEIDPLTLRDLEMMQEKSNMIWMVKHKPELLKEIRK